MRRRTAGFTLVELVVVVAIIAVMIVISITGMDGWEDAEAARVSARSVDGAFAFARSEAIRTGHNHMVFIQQDTTGAALTAEGGTSVPILVLDDGLPGSANQNCLIDAGEPTQGFRIDRVSFGSTLATANAPNDTATGTRSSGTTFTNGVGGPASWVLIRPDGSPRAATTACVMGALGSGNGGVYLRNAAREVAVVLTPLGASRVYTLREGANWN